MAVGQVRENAGAMPAGDQSVVTFILYGSACFTLGFFVACIFAAAGRSSAFESGYLAGRREEPKQLSEEEFQAFLRDVDEGSS